MTTTTVPPARDIADQQHRIAEMSAWLSENSEPLGRAEETGRFATVLELDATDIGCPTLRLHYVSSRVAFDDVAQLAAELGLQYRKSEASTFHVHHQFDGVIEDGFEIRLRWLEPIETYTRPIDYAGKS